MNKIREIYSKNEKHQRIINVKEMKERKILIDYRKNYSLKLKNIKSMTIFYILTTKSLY